MPQVRPNADGERVSTGPNRRGLLLASTVVAATSALAIKGSTETAQAQQQPPLRQGRPTSSISWSTIWVTVNSAAIAAAFCAGRTRSASTPLPPRGRSFSTSRPSSRIAAVGPQIGFIFPIGDMQGYINLKGYKEFAAQNRPEGWNTWLTFAISPASPEPASAKPLVRKY
jgi:hypothetical protein